MKKLKWILSAFLMLSLAAAMLTSSKKGNRGSAE